MFIKNLHYNQDQCPDNQKSSTTEQSFTKPVSFSYRCENDKSWSMHDLSDNCYQVLSVGPSQLVSGEITFASLIHTDEQELCWDIVQRAINSQSPFQSKYRIVTPDGKIKLVHEQGQGVFTRSGKLRYLEGFIGEILAPNQASYRSYHVDDINLCIKELNALATEHGLHTSNLDGEIRPVEINILLHACLGKTMKQIASILCLSPRTVEVYQVKLRKKLGCVNISQAKELFLESKIGKELLVDHLYGQCKFA